MGSGIERVSSTIETLLSRFRTMVRSVGARRGLVDADLDDVLQEALSTDRRIAVRFHLSGYDRNDIARSLVWSEARTRNLVYRGLDDLRQRLAAMGITPESAR